MTFDEYLNRVRVNKAKELLRRRELRMTDISLAVGYEDQSYFTKVFKRVAGMLPREYREKIQSWNLPYSNLLLPHNAGIGIHSPKDGIAVAGFIVKAAP